MGSLRPLFRSCQSFLPQNGRGTTLLCYHLVDGGTLGPVDLPVTSFQRQMEELRELGWDVALNEALSDAKPTGDPGLPGVVVTFDDAFENFFTSAWPVLRELEIPASLFVPVGFVEGETGAPISSSPALNPVSWDQLQELVHSDLVSIGSHSWSHRDLRKLPEEEVLVELRRSKEVLEDRLGIEVTSFCYPRGLWSRRVERLVGEVYELAVVAGGRRLTPGKINPLRIWRIPIRRDMPESLEPILSAPVWLEEWVADKARRYLH